MIFGPIRVAAVDDNPGHLIAITTGLNALGVPCVGYWYDKSLNELRPVPPADGLPFLRLIFMDLNLAELAGVPDASTLASTAMSVLSQVVARDGGPYVLVFWTQVGTRVEAVKNLIWERLERVSNSPAPIAILELDKNPFLISLSEPGDFTKRLETFLTELHARVDELKSAVISAIESDTQVAALGAWETRAAQAAASATNEIYACARNDATTPSERSDTVRRVLAKVAIAGGGRKLANASPARALEAGMLDILVDKFGSSADASGYVSATERAIKGALEGPITFSDERRLFASLNRFFQLDAQVTEAKPADRGVVSRAKPKKSLLGVEPNDLVNREFLFSENQHPEEVRKEITDLRREFDPIKRLVLVEVGADCDHAQGSDRTGRFLLGLDVPEKFLRLCRHPDGRRLRNESLQLLGPWWFEGESRHLIVSCRRFIISQDGNVEAGTTPIYRLRASVVGKLLHHYAHWSSRPGIVEVTAEPEAPAYRRPTVREASPNPTQYPPPEATPTESAGSVDAVSALSPASPTEPATDGGSAHTAQTE